MQSSRLRLLPGGLIFRVWGFGFGIQGFGLELRVQRFGFTSYGRASWWKHPMHGDGRLGEMGRPERSKNLHAYSNGLPKKVYLAPLIYCLQMFGPLG